jgi:hypothetical protein
LDHAKGPSALLGVSRSRFDRIRTATTEVLEMTAMAVRQQGSTQETGATPQAGVTEEVAAAERSWWRGVIIGMAIGIPVCAVLWVGLVALALAVADTGWPVVPALGMAAVVGVFAGVFFGGWAGVTVKAEELDHAEWRSQSRT